MYVRRPRLAQVCFQAAEHRRRLTDTRQRWSTTDARVYSNVQIPLDGPDQTLSLVGSGRVVSKFHYMDPTRPDSRTAWVSDKSAGLCLVVDLSAQSRHVRTLSAWVWSGLVGSQTKSVIRV